MQKLYTMLLQMLTHLTPDTKIDRLERELAVTTQKLTETEAVLRKIVTRHHELTEVNRILITVVEGILQRDAQLKPSPVAESLLRYLDITDDEFIN